MARCCLVFLLARSLYLEGLRRAAACATAAQLHGVVLACNIAGWLRFTAVLDPFDLLQAAHALLLNLLHAACARPPFAFVPVVSRPLLSLCCGSLFAGE